MSAADDTIREILAITGMKQGAFSKKVGVAQGTVSKWMSGTMSPNKRQWDAVLDLIREDRRLTHLLPPGAAVSIPLIDFVSAGRLASPSAQIPVEDVPLLAFADLGRGDFFALTVRGDSMDRVSPDGSTIVVDRSDKTLVAGKPFVFSVKGQATYKLWRPDPPRLAPFSTNPSNEPIFVKKKQEMVVVGRVRRTVLDL